jgi:hypothetical protein
VAILALLALAAACNGNGDGDSGDSTPPPADSPGATTGADGGSIGEHDDVNNFIAFGEELDVALAEGDAQFFFDHTLYQDAECGAEFPAPPASCEGQAADSTVLGITVGVFQFEGFALDQAGYGEFIREYLTTYAQDAPVDAYGGPEPKLYAYGRFAPEFTEVPPDGAVETLHAIATRVAPAEPELVPGIGRTALYIGASFIDDEWRIEHLHVGPLGYINPFSPEAAEVGTADLFDFWLLWQDRPQATPNPDAESDH